MLSPEERILEIVGSTMLTGGHLWLTTLTIWQERRYPKLRVTATDSCLIPHFPFSISLDLTLNVFLVLCYKLRCVQLCNLIHEISPFLLDVFFYMLHIYYFLTDIMLYKEKQFHLWKISVDTHINIWRTVSFTQHIYQIHHIITMFYCI